MSKKQGSSVDSASKQAIPAVESIDPVFKNDGQRALVACARGNYTKALKIIGNSISCHQDSPHLHNVEALIHLGLAENVAKDSAEKSKHLTHAAQSAQMATALLPNSVGFASKLVSVHFQLAEIGAEDWSKVTELCERGLNIKIEDSTDPGIDQFLKESEMVKSSKESRINDERKKIMEHLRASEQKNRIYSAKEDKVADRKDKEKEENAVKKYVKELEKRRNQIDAVIESHDCVKNYDSDDENIEKRKKYKHFWIGTLSSEKKRDFRKVIIEDLESHFKSLKHGLALDRLSEAIGFAKENKSWRYWECCVCQEKFGDCHLYKNHMKKLHRLNLDELELQFAIGSEWIEMIENCEWKPVDPNVTTDIVKQMKSEFYSTGNCFLDDQEWRYCDDSERAESLEKIREILHLLLENKCLAPVHLIWAVLYTVDRLGFIIPASQFRHNDQENHNVVFPLHHVISLLGAPELQELLKILKHLAQTCGLSKIPGRGSSMDSKFSGCQGCCIREKVVFSKEFSCLFLDGRLSQGELNLTNHYDAVGDICEDGVIPDGDDILSWLYAGPRIGEDLELWTSLRDSQREKAEDVFGIIIKEISERGKMIDLLSEIWEKMGAILDLDSIYLEEISNRENNPENVAQLQVNNDTVSRTESDIISNDEELAIEALKSLGADQSESEECRAELESRMMMDAEKNSQHRKIKQMKNIAFINAIVLRSASVIQQYEQILEKCTVYDYRSIIVPLLRSFLQTHLEDLFDKDAIDKSEAAREALLAQLALDAEKNVNEVGDHVRQKHYKKNKKKKKKNFRKAKESKATNGSVHFQLHENEAEQVDNQNSEIGVCESAEELKELTEMEDKKLFVHLEYQKQIENEAKQKCLAEKRLQADIQKAVYLSLDSFEKHYGPLTNDVKDCQTPPLDLLQYVIIQSQWRLRQLRDEFMSRSEIWHTHAGSPCFLCAYHDSFAAACIASRDMPEEAFVPTTSRKFAVQHFLQEWLKTKDLDDKDATVIYVSTSAYELKQVLVAKVRKIYEELEHKRQIKNVAKQKEKNSKQFNEKHVKTLQSEIDKSLKGEELRASLVNPNVLGTGLRIETADCFLKLIIQVLWNLREFREEFMSRSQLEHEHVENPCIVCALYDNFSALKDNAGEVIASTSFRVALSTCCHNKKIFQEGQTNDASELLQAILWSLHESFTVTLSDSESESIFKGSLDCSSAGCFVHTIFGMDHYENINCVNCFLESRHRKYSSLSLTVNVSNLITMKRNHEHHSFDMLLKLVEMSGKLICDSNEGGCGQINQIYHTLWCLPHVFTIVLDWQNAAESFNDSSATLSALSSELDLSILFHGYQPENIYFLVSMVCFSGVRQHYICFIYNHELGKYVLHDDINVKVIGSWNDVVAVCLTMCLQPLILFFLHKSSKYFTQANS